MDSWAHTIGEAVGPDTIVDVSFNATGSCKVYAEGDVEAAKRVAYLTFPDLEVSLALDKKDRPGVRQMYMINVPKEW